jgi:negative regulator of replication initiation
LYFSSSDKPMMLFGGREVKFGHFSSSGLWTKKGSRTDMKNVMIEKAMRAVEPIRPTLPVRSPAALTSAGASYRR